MPPASLPPRPAKIQEVEIYGLRVPKTVSRIGLELACYRTKRGKDQGGLGPEEHFRRAWRMLWPNYEWSDWLDMQIHAWCNFKWITVAGHERAGKCLGKGTPVMLYDGTVIPVEDVRVGMQLMGDDSTPRNVLSLARGREMLYRVKASRGGEWVCNRSHILSLKMPVDLKHRNGHLTHRAGEVVDIPLVEFEKKGIFFRSVWKQYQVGVEFPKAAAPLTVDPYVYGAWLAEGGKGLPCICSYDGPMVRRWCEYWEKRGARIKVHDLDRVPVWFVRYHTVDAKIRWTNKHNPCTEFIRKSVIDGQKRVLREYLTASRTERLALLAGYLDGDGHTPKRGQSNFEFVSVDEGLVNDLVFLARSLGFYASVGKKRTSCRSRNYIGEAWKGYIGGNVSEIPTLQKHPKRGQSNDPLCQSIKVEPIGVGDFYGFELDGNRRFLLGDFTVTHNTYNFAHAAFLDYCADPLNTLTSLTTVTFEGLKLRMWSDLLRACETAETKHIPVGLVYAIRSTTNEMRIYPKESGKEAAEKYQIHGMAVNNTKDAEGRIRGGHAPRRRIILDEAENIAAPIYEAMINPMSAPDAICAMLTNPIERMSNFGKWCEPEGGWSSVNDTDLIWKTKKGGICLHFDGLQSPNVRQGKKVFTGLLTQDNVDEVRKIHGEDSVQWWALIRGWWPPDGLISRVFPSGTIEKGKPQITFDFRPEKCATLDPAFEHDNCVLHLGQLGKLRNGNAAISASRTITMKLQVGASFEPKDYQIAHKVMEICAQEGIQPAHFIMDRSGGGRGVFAILQKEWSTDVHGIEYGGSATERPISAGGPRACDAVKYFVSELWFRARHAIEDGVLGGLSSLDDRTIEDLMSRRYELKTITFGKVQQVHTKDEVKKILGRSPDYGDAFVQFAELLVRLTGLTRNLKHGAPAQKWARLRERARVVGARGNPDGDFSH